MAESSADRLLRAVEVAADGQRGKAADRKAAVAVLRELVEMETVCRADRVKLLGLARQIEARR